MYLCYLDESGSPEIGKDTPHFVFLGLAIPASTWRRKDAEIAPIKSKYGLAVIELHAAWMARHYVEQEKITNFADLDWPGRRKAFLAERDATLLKIAAIKGPEATKNLRRTFRQIEPYVHLTRDERLNCLREVAELIGGWRDSRLFAEAIDKTSFGAAPKYPPFEEAFSQVVSRFHVFLERRGSERDFGLLVQDNNQTAAKRLTELARFFHKSGTLFTRIPRIVETPLFVDSSLTSMVQLADLCVYASRRFFENRETRLFDPIYPIFDRDGMRLIGIRHYTGDRVCDCKVCVAHRHPPTTPYRRPAIKRKR
jgi:hypothetical protein